MSFCICISCKAFTAVRVVEHRLLHKPPLTCMEISEVCIHFAIVGGFIQCMHACTEYFIFPRICPQSLSWKVAHTPAGKSAAERSNTHTVWLKCWHWCFVHRCVYINGYFKRCSWTGWREHNRIGSRMTSCGKQQGSGLTSVGWH